MSKQRLIPAYRILVEQRDFKEDPAQLAVLEKLESRLDAFESWERKQRWWHRLTKAAPIPKGLYIYGGVGQGKTFMMDLCFEHLKGQKRRYHFHDLMRIVHHSAHHWRAQNKGRRMFTAIAAEVTPAHSALFLDEFHVTDIADAMILQRLLDALFAQGTMLITTSNTAPKDLYKDGLKRDNFLPTISLLQHNCFIHHIHAKQDYRLGRMASLQTLYFTPLGSGADRFIEDSIATLTHGDAPHPIDIVINGRTLHFSRCYGDILVTDFDTLCRRPMGTEDYLEIAASFHTLILKNIPKLSPEERNEAKRFITLIDALYDHRVKLICSANVLPHEIYETGHNVELFTRTISRLIEMQAENYLEIAHC